MRKLIIAVITALSLVGNSTLSFCAQEQEKDNPLQVSVNLVRVDVSVFGRDEKPAFGFTKDDFELYEEGALQEIKYISHYSIPLSIVIVVDQSGSLYYVFRDVKKAAGLILRPLGPDDEVAIVSFDDEVRVSTGFTTDKNKAIEALAGISNKRGGTNISAALIHAVGKLSGVNPARRKAIILISDNIDTSTSRIYAEKSKIIEMMVQNNLTFYNLKIGDAISNIYPAPPSSGEDLVRELVHQNGGQMIDTRESNLTESLATAIKRLKYTYSLFYTPRASDKARARKIDVRLKNNPRSKFPPFQKKYNVISKKYVFY